MKVARYVLAVVVVAIAIVALWGGTGGRRAVDSDAPRQESTAEQKEIIAAIQTYSDVNAQAMATGDLELLATILIDHPVFRQTLEREKYAALKDYIEMVSGADVANSDFGYLTAMQNKIRHRRHGRALLQEAFDAATAENRELTDADLAALYERNYGSMIGISLASLDASNQSETSSSDAYYREEQFSSIEIRGDRADAYYERVRGWHAILIRIDGKWYIAQVL